MTRPLAELPPGPHDDDPGASPGTPITVAICEDDESIIEDLSAALASAPDLRLVGLARSRAEAHQLLQRTTARVLLLDLGLPDGSGIDLIPAAHRHWPGCVVLVSTVFGDEGHVIRCLEAGATGYLLKDERHDRIADGIRTAVAGGSPISPLIARQLLVRFGLSRSSQALAVAPDDDGRPRLSPREQEVLVLISKGFNYEEIAQLMRVSRNTVLSFVRRIYAKLEVRSQVEALHEARSFGILPP